MSESKTQIDPNDPCLHKVERDLRSSYTLKTGNPNPPEAFIKELAKKELESRFKSIEREQEIARQRMELENMRHEIENNQFEGLFLPSKIYTRRMLDQLLPVVVEDAKRSNSSLAVFFIDLDHFKEVNDRYGHIQADGILRSLGAAMSEVGKRTNDINARFGGEELVMLLPGLTEEQAQIWACGLSSTFSDLQSEALRFKHGDPSANSKAQEFGEFPELDKNRTLSIGVSYLAPDDPRMRTESLAQRLLSEANSAEKAAKLKRNTIFFTNGTEIRHLAPNRIAQLTQQYQQLRANEQSNLIAA